MCHGLPQPATDSDRSLCGHGRLHAGWAQICSGCTKAVRHGDATNHAHAAPSPVGRPVHLRGDSTRVLPIHVESRLPWAPHGRSTPRGARRCWSPSPPFTSRVALTATTSTIDRLRPFGATPTSRRTSRRASPRQWRPAMCGPDLGIPPATRVAVHPVGAKGRRFDCGPPRRPLHIGSASGSCCCSRVAPGHDGAGGSPRDRSGPTQ
jgi:hypothetical protein